MWEIIRGGIVAWPERAVAVGIDVHQHACTDRRDGFVVGGSIQMRVDIDDHADMAACVGDMVREA